MIEAARGIHRAIGFDAVLAADDVVFLAVSGGGVDRAGALFQRDVIGQDAERIAFQKRMMEDRAFETRSGETRQYFIVGPAALFGGDFQKFGGHDVDGTGSGWGDRGILVFGMKRDGHVGRDGPGRGSPDEAVDVAAGERGIDRGGIGSQGEAHPYGRARMVGVFDFGFGQRGAVAHAPVHRLQAFVDVAPVQEFHERGGDHRLVLRAHGEIRVVPTAEDAQALEIRALQVHVFLGVFAAFGADLGRSHFGFARAELAIDLDFDGQAVAVPAGDIGGIEARHGLGFDDEILEYLVERGAQVNAAVGVGRAIVQDVSGPAGARAADLAVDILAVPALEQLRLGLGEVGLHREAGAGQIDSLLQINVMRVHFAGIIPSYTTRAG